MPSIILHFLIKLFSLCFQQGFPGCLDEVVVEQNVDLFGVVGLHLLFEGLVDELEVLLGGLSGHVDWSVEDGVEVGVVVVW
jgi:hypothetical protein